MLWTETYFLQECKAWMEALKENQNGHHLVCKEFSQWTLDPSERFLFTFHAQNEVEMHICYSPSYQCPILLLRNPVTCQLDYTLQPGFVGSVDFHPVLGFQVFFTIHACETKRNLQPLMDENSAPGTNLLKWYVCLLHTALHGFHVSHDVFLLSMQQLQEVYRIS